MRVAYFPSLSVGSASSMLLGSTSVNLVSLMAPSNHSFRVQIPGVFVMVVRQENLRRDVNSVSQCPWKGSHSSTLHLRKGYPLQVSLWRRLSMQ